MRHDFFATAIKNLRPNAEWSMIGQDVEGITWLTPNVQPLTTDEVEAEVARLEKALEDETAAKKAAKASSLIKLRKLGLTDDEISAILSE